MFHTLVKRRDRKERRQKSELLSIFEACERWWELRREEGRTPSRVRGGDSGKPGRRGRHQPWGRASDRIWHPEVALALGMTVIIAHGGSSSPGPYIFHTGAAGAPYSGRRHPGRLAFLKAAVCVDRR